ncbi:IS66 family insertion sequence element accessory protein TnpB, partial [Puniceibacterium confluentis]|uniref:IS66 family insertion sequence element accessory protein TnpB n=1 Tax=Puniceibacterium confluentis TaxID=1958944 RepID=UPI003566FB51
SNRVRIMIATKPVDFRKGHDGLAALVKNELRKEPFTGTVFVFRARRANRHSFHIPKPGTADRISVASAFWSCPARPRWWP